MVLGEYLRIRITRKGRTTKANVLTAREAREIGIPSPLEKNWATRYKNVEVPQWMVDMALQKEPVMRVPKKKRKNIILEEAKREKRLQESERKRGTSNAPAERGVNARKMFKDSFISSDEFLSTYEWRKIRMVALKKCGARCQCCGASPTTGAVMNVDHIKPRKTHPELALDLDNLQVLCHVCNHGKGNWDSTDWRGL